MTADRRWYVTAPAGTTVAGGGDEIALVARAEEDGVVSEVWDSGSGIPLQDAERVFDRFRRLEGSPAGGSGLGLSIVRGDRRVSRRTRLRGAPSAGGGATLRMTLPRLAHRQTRRAPGYSSVGPTTWATQASSP